MARKDIVVIGASAGGMEALQKLVSRLPAGAVSTDERVRRERAIDSWTLDLLRRVRGDELTEPAAVVFPASTEEVATVLAWAAETGTAVIPRGAGSGVCGGARALAGAVILDLTRMDRVGDVDLVSQTVDVRSADATSGSSAARSNRTVGASVDPTPRAGGKTRRPFVTRPTSWRRPIRWWATVAATVTANSVAWSAAAPLAAV